jgi:hypothetical protein
MVIGGTTGWAVVQLRSAVAGPRMLVMARAALLPPPRSQRPACQRRSCADGRPLGRAGALAAGMWIGGVGARLAFAVAATYGAGPAIARFSIAHQITGSAAWVAALVMMALADVLTRLVIIYLRGRRLATGSAATAARIPAGLGA